MSLFLVEIFSYIGTRVKFTVVLKCLTLLSSRKSEFGGDGDDDLQQFFV